MSACRDAIGLPERLFAHEPAVPRNLVMRNDAYNIGTQRVASAYAHVRYSHARTAMSLLCSGATEATM